MSLCRFSCMNHSSDLYIYQDNRGDYTYTVHVATNRLKSSPPECLMTSKAFNRVKLARDKQRRDFFESVERESINHSLAGAMIEVDSPEELLQKLSHLKECGFKYPDYVEDAINCDIEERDLEGSRRKEAIA